MGCAFNKAHYNDKIGALNDYNEAIALKSSNVGHYINRGILHYQNKNYRNALATTVLLLNSIQTMSKHFSIVPYCVQN